MDQGGQGAIKWTRLSCRTFAANAVRLQLHALAYNLGNFLRTLATPEPIKDWSLISAIFGDRGRRDGLHLSPPAPKSGRRPGSRRCIAGTAQLAVELKKL